MTTNHQVIVVGAGPGGIAVAAALKDIGVNDVVILEKGVVGEAWLDYPAETHLLSESFPENDLNMIDDVSTADVFPHMPHPSHVIYQKYLEHVVKEKKVQVLEKTNIKHVLFNQSMQKFVLETTDDRMFTSDFLVWATGMFCTPNENLESAGCYVHYAKLPYLANIEADEVTVVGSANGASGVVLQLAKPGRVVTLVSGHPYEVPNPVDCLWKEQVRFIKELEMQGLVKIVENFRVKKVFEKAGEYVLKSEDGQEIKSKTKPIVCTGFLPNIEPIKDLIEEREEGHENILDIDEHRQSKKTSHLYIGGVIAKISSDEGMISKFREFGKVIAQNIQLQMK